MHRYTSQPVKRFARLAAAALLLASQGVLGATVNLNAAPTSTTLPDGQSVPMWGYQCLGGDTVATCAAANPNAGGNWSPVVITVPYSGVGTSLTINLTNSLSFAAGTTLVPTSLTIVGQLGGGLELVGGIGHHTTTLSPTHAPQGTTWPGIGGIDSSASSIKVDAGGSGYTSAPTVILTPGVGGGSGATAKATVSGGVVTGITLTSLGSGYTEAPTVSFSGGGGSGAAASLSWAAYQTAGSPTAIAPAQGPRVQSFGTEVLAGAATPTALTWSNLRPGTYLIESGTHPSIQGPMGLYGVLVVTGSAQTFPTDVKTPTTAASAFDASVPVVLSEIDPVQNAAVATAVATAGFSETAVWSGQVGACGNPSVHNCYPPAVNFSPRYYLVNGVSFDRTSIGASTAQILASATATSGNVALRLVNAGLRMHIPSVVGLPMTLIAEDGNPLPGVPRLQNEVFLAAGKSYDVIVKPTQAAGSYARATYPIFDRQLSLSTNNQRDGGMQAYIAVAGGATAGVGVAGAGGSDTQLSGVVAKTYYCVSGRPLDIADPQRGLLGGTSGANGVSLTAATLAGTLSLQTNGTFSYTPPPAPAACGGTFSYTVNNLPAPAATITQCDASSSANPGCTLGGPPVLHDDSFAANNAKQLLISPPGVLLNDVDPAGRTLSVDPSTINAIGGLTVTVNADGSFVAYAPAAGSYSFTYNVKNSQGTPALAPATVSLTFPTGSGLAVTLVDQKHGWTLANDYRWIIEEDRTFWIDPKCQVNTGGAVRPKDSYGRDCPAVPVEALGYNFHSAGMPVVATGCMGSVSCESGQTLLGEAAVCDVGNGVCRTTATQRQELSPADVALDPNKHYFISVLPGDGINPSVAGVGGPVTDSNGRTRKFDPALDCPTEADFAPGSGSCGHNMGGGQIAPAFDPRHNPIAPAITISLAETPLPTARIAVLVYEDDYPLNGENDAGGGVDIVAPNEAGLGGFQIELLDQAGGLGDNTGQITYDMFNMPVTNSLAGTLDPMTGLNACPIGSNADNNAAKVVTCPTYESDGKTRSPLAGQAVIENLYPGLYEVTATPSADRIARGEEWLQTNTLDGGKPHEAFVRPGEPSYFQEFGPGGFHIQMGFANPKIINDRRVNSAGTGLCDPAPKGGGLNCHSSITGQVHGNHMSRTPDERTFDTGSYDAFAFSNCYVALGVPDEQDFAFTKCDSDGKFSFTGLPDGVFKLAVFDQWNDIMLDGLVTAVNINGVTPVTVTATQWRTNLYTRTYIDLNNDGIPNRDGDGKDLEQGIPLLPITVRYRDGSIGFRNGTDLSGYATYNEVFPFMNWLIVEPDTTRYKQTSQHVVYDAGGADDCTADAAKCSNTAAHLAATNESNSLPVALRVPGAVYCLGADCTDAGDAFTGSAYLGGTAAPAPTTGLSSGRIDPPWHTEGWQGLLGQHSFIDFGMKPFKAGETGGIQGMVVYASTRPFDDPTLLVQLNWEPGVANVQVNLYKEDLAADGSKTLTLVDTTVTSSFDKWSQGFRTDGTGTGTLLQMGDGSYIPNMNCPGQDPTSGFFATLAGSKMWLDYDAAGNATTTYNGDGTIGGAKHKLAYNAQFKCFDGWSMLNQIEPAPYDGRYQFPSIVDRNPASGRPSGQGKLNGVNTPVAGTNCSICTANAVDPSDPIPVLPPGKYVVEVVTPQGYEVVKEEDKNILVGDIYVAPVTQQFAGLGNIFIMPDQAAMNAFYNANNAVNATTNLGVQHTRQDFASTDQLWPCVGQTRIVPDTMSLFPSAGQTAPFAGASRPLCDRKEVTLHDQESLNAKFYMFTKNHVAGHFVGGMTNDMASEFDPFSPQFGEKFGVPNLPIRMRNFVGDEVTRVYADQWGAYNGMYFSSWEVNPPNPTGYAPQMSVACMNDPGPIKDLDPDSPTHGQMITDPAYSPAYSNFCYETPFMPGFTAYMDTPVTPVQAFADHYNLPDAEYPDATPVIKRADFQGNIGPWSSASAGLSAVTVTTSGSGYSSTPSVGFSGGGGSGAVASATMKVAAIAVGSGGTYTTVPTVTLSGGGYSTLATATACLGVSSVAISNQGAGYVQNGNGRATVSFASPPNGGTRATGTVTLTSGRITAVNMTNRGCGYTSAPAITFGGNRTTVAVASATLGVASVSVGNAGAGYTSAPTVGFSGGTVAATATASLGVSALTLTSSGSGYTSAPSVTFNGGGGSGTVASATLGALTATAPLVLKSFGDRVVQNPQFAGPSASAAPYNQKTVTRHYGFGARCSSVGTGCAAVSGVTVGGLAATINSWDDGTINVSMPSGMAACPIAQRNVTTPAVCGEVVVTAGNGKQSIDGITVTIGGKAPTIVTTASPSSNKWGEFYPNPLQTAIDNATPGDLLILEAGAYRENVIMWKPVRLQGVGAGAVTINADAQPAGKMDAWRRRISCLFGLTIQGAPMTNVAQYDTSGEYSCPAEMYFRADRIPFEGFIGWDASSNGNLAQVLQEPSLMGAYEGAGVTVVGRGVNQAGVPRGSADLWGQIAGAGGFADGSRYVNGTSDCSTASKSATTADYGTGNFLCNPSSIDGVSVMNSSQGGGGIYLHGWNHYLQIANTRISANAGTLGGGINLGSGEAPPGFMLDGATCFAANDPNRPSPLPFCPPIPAGITVQENGAIPLQLNTYVHIHHNQIIDNASIGDALFSGSPAGAGGVTISAGSDFYQLDHNWIAANLTSSDGGGVAHIGVSFNSKINNNYVLFNQANNPTLPVDGGGIMIMGAQHDRTLASGVECGTTSDIDCPPGMGEGTGPNLVIDANLILGNSAEDGSGGGLRLRQINGEEVSVFPRTPDQWYGVTVTNNIIVNNVAGWDGGGVSLQDAFKIQFVNNTVASNDTTASAGVLFKTLGAIMASSPPPGCLPTADPTQPQNPNCMLTNGPHIPQPAGLVTMQNTPNMMAGMGRYFDNETGGWANNTSIVCPAGYGYGNAADTLASRTNGRCLLIGLPSVVNDLFWQNRAFHVEIVDSNGNAVTGTPTPNGQGLYSHQNIVALLPLVKQTFTGQCVDQASLPQVNGAAQQLYWDVGVRMDGLPNANGHNLYFDIPTVAGGYALEAAATAVLGGTFTQAATAAATVSPTIPHRLSSITVLNGGAGYTAVPTVTISGGGGTGATATATLVNGVVTAVTLGSGSGRGTNYTSAPTVSFSVAGAGTVRSISVWNPGAGYIATPTVTLVGGGGSGATATAIRSNAGLVTGVTVTNAGSGYTTAPDVVFSGGGLTPNSTDTSSSAGIALTAKNSIFSDNVNLLNTTAVSGSPSLVPASTPVQGQYCNGARIPPEQCSTNQGANNQGMCLGYFTPAGQSETFGVAPVFVFNGIKASATVDEGNNWINMTYGPLSLSRPVAGNGAVSAEPTVASAAVAAAGGAYTIMLGSEAIDAGANAGSVTSHDFFGLARPQGSSFDIGAMELPPIPVTIALTKTASVSSANPGNVFTYTISATNSGAINLVGGKIIDTLPAGITGTWTCAASGGASCASASGTGNITAASGGAVGLPVGGSVTFVINATVTNAATNGNRVNTVTVLMPAGYGNSLSNTASATVNVVVPPPTLTAINPVGLIKGATLASPNTVAATLTGTWLTGATGITVKVASSGATEAAVYCDTLVVVSPTSATAHCTAWSTATGGAHNVTITTPSGESNAVSLNVISTPPVLSVPGQPTAFGYYLPYSYATTVIGMSTGATFTLTNPAGSGGPVTVGVITLLGDYQLASNNCTNGLSVAAGASCTFVVNFVPTASGTRNGNVSIDVPGVGTVTLPMGIGSGANGNLTGTGKAPGVLTSSPAETCGVLGCAISGYNALSFGSHAIGVATSATFTYTKRATAR